MSDEWLRWYVVAIAVLTVLPAWASVIVHTRTPWRRTRLGRHLMAYMFVLALTFTTLTMDMFMTPDPTWVDVLGIVTYTFTPIVVWWRLILQVRVAREPGPVEPVDH